MIAKGAELPESWALSTLAATAILAKDKVDPARTPDVPYLGLEHVEAHTMRIVGHGRGSDVKSLKNKFSAGDVLYGKLRPYLNKVARPDFDGICSTDFLVFKDSPALDSGYLANYLNQLWVAGRAHHLSNGIELPRVDWKSLSQLPIAHPKSKVDQRRIVEQIDAVRGLQSSAGSHLGVAQRSVARFRQAVLASACSGRLTADWRESQPHAIDARSLVSNIDEMRRDRLGRKYKQHKYADGDDELPGSWTWVALGSLVDVATGATPLRTRADYYGGEIPWVTSGAVNAGTIVAASETITELALKETNAKVFPAGTLLVAMYGEGQTRGRVAELGIDAATNQAVAALLFDPASEPLRPYLKLYLLRNYDRIRSLSFGGVQPNLSLGVIRNTPIPVPPLEEQREIVRRVDRLFALASGIQQRIELASKRTERSSQAVLAKAFSGELVPESGASNGR